MDDNDLLRVLEFPVEKAAKTIRVTRQVLYRALHCPAKTRRGTAGDDVSGRKRYYLNADRLLAIWAHFVREEKYHKANIVRDEIVARYPLLAQMVSPYEARPGNPDEVQFSEAWIFSREPLEMQSIPFRVRMREPLQSKQKRLVYFVPSELIAQQLLAVLQVAADHVLEEVYIVVTPTVLAAPHWFVLYTSAQGHDMLTGIFPETAKGLEPWTRVACLPAQAFRAARDTLMEAGLLDINERFNPSFRSYGTQHYVDLFQVFYPQAV